MITKYKLFETLNTHGSKSLTESEFDQIQKSNCKNWTKAKTSLYRGQNNLGDYVYTDPRGTHRKSIDDVNTHIELMDELPCWKEYPKYSASVIGISDQGAAVGYGYDDVKLTLSRRRSMVYEVIPFDNSDIVVCPHETIWNSLGGFGDEDPIYLTHYFLNKVQKNAGSLSLTYDKIGIENMLKDIPNIMDLFPQYKQNPNFHNTPGHLFLEFLSQASEDIGKDKNEISGEDCYNFLNDYLFNPVVRKFEIVKYTPGFEIPLNRQIWISEPVLLISTDKS